MALLPLSLFAENIDAYGVTLKFEEVAPVDGGGVKLTLNGRSEIARADRVTARAVEMYIAANVESNADRLSPEQYAKIAVGALKSKDSDLAVQVLKALLVLDVEPDAKEISRISDALQLIQGADGAQDLFKRILVDAHSRMPKVLTFGLLFSVGLEDPAWVSEYGISIALTYGSLFHDYCVSALLQLLARADFINFSKGVDFTALVFDSGDSQVRRFKTVEIKIHEFLAGGDAIDQNHLVPLFDLERADPETYAALRPLLVKKVQAVAERELAAGNPVQALRTLGMTEDPTRAQSILELTSQILMSISDADFVHEATNENLRFLGAASRQDPEVRELFKDKVGYLTNFYIEAGKVGLLGNLLEILQQKADSGVALVDIEDEVRLRKAANLSILDRADLAAEEVVKLHGELSLTSKLKLLWSGYYVERNYLFALLLSPFLAAVIFFAFPRFRIGEALAKLVISKKKPLKDSAGFVKRGGLRPGEAFGTNDDQRGSGGYVSARSRYIGHPRFGEYQAALRLLGLSAKSNLAEIKSVYRNLAKNAHPDIAPGSTSTASDRFIEINRAYEVLLEIRREMNVPDSAGVGE